MSPPKKQTTVASDFFTRGKKPTTNARVITAKRTIVPASTPLVKPAKKQIEQDDIDEVQDFDSDEDEDDAHAESEEEEHDEREEEEEDLSVVRDDEIQSDDSDFGFGLKVERATPPMPVTTTTQHKLPGRITSAPASVKGARGNKKLIAAPTYVDVGDIHVGFHQADLSEQEKLLRQFDLASKYGPCTDMTRMERWERAFILGLNPPQDIKDTLSEYSTLNTPLFEGRV
ncbi:hypothetical protein CPB97_000447 [Podila verticillata]|nr:hypothetical protein CPB97_000447 [Podila verticillata]